MADQPASIFNASNPEATPPVAQTPVSNGENVQNDNGLSTLLASIKNERGEVKYKDPIEALKGLQHAQEYIPTLKQELSQKDQELQRLRDENLRLKTVEETILTLNSQNQTPASQQAPQGLDEKQIAELVRNTLSQRESESLQKTNLSSVVTNLQQVFGADAEKVFYAKAQEMGMSAQEMNALAAKSPKAVLTMLGVKEGTRPVTPASGSVNTSAFQQKQESYVGRNIKSAMTGASTEDLKYESDMAKKMTQEIHDQGFNVSDLSDPKVYNKYFNRK